MIFLNYNFRNVNDGIGKIRWLGNQESRAKDRILTSRKTGFTRAFALGENLFDGESFPVRGGFHGDGLHGFALDVAQVGEPFVQYGFRGSGHAETVSLLEHLFQNSQDFEAGASFELAQMFSYS